MAPSAGLLNAILTGLVTGSIIALGAIGLSLVYDIAEVPNFAHGDLLTLGAYAALLVNKPQSVPLFDVFGEDHRNVEFRFVRLDPDSLTGRREAPTPE